MAKALFGHVGGPDPRMVLELRRLQMRVRDLENVVMRLQAQNDRLSETITDLTVSTSDREPALA